ncbi:hypothetical protein O181_100795 [Austropuccinia psidii MF-1]|uniref:Uncharacterized protein n=1 Tax=Austropuccinia psidii MF-1 TaxID=1389203 RepID=A0A9Q3PH66_9BASI|nr:hypothetical protein [Austropuccinia psidii MF-1]
MTPTRSERNYSIQSNGSGPGHSSQKSKRQECQPRGEAQMEDARTSASSQSLASTFDTLIESPEADISAVPVIRLESFSAGNNRDIPVSVEELVYGGKAAGVGTSAKYLVSVTGALMEARVTWHSGIKNSLGRLQKDKEMRRNKFL